MPDDAGAFARALGEARLRRFTHVDYRKSTASTNTDAQALLGDPQHAGRLIVADYQTAGAGRRNRRWVAPAGSGLLFTAILPDPIATEASWAVPLWAGVGVAAALEQRGVRATLQWPNDLLVEGRKLCGILCVSRIAGDRAWIGCGVGVNVVRPANDPELDAIVPPPLFLSDVVSLGPSARPDLLASIASAFEHDLASLDDPERVARRWEDRAELPGVPYRFAIDGEEEIEGTAIRIATGGGLVVRTAGAERTIGLAEARVIRPTPA